MVSGALWGALGLSLGAFWGAFGVLGMPLGSICIPLATIGSHFALLVCTLGVLEALSGDLEVPGSHLKSFRDYFGSTSGAIASVF